MYEILLVYLPVLYIGLIELYNKINSRLIFRIIGYTIQTKPIILLKYK